MGEHIVLFHSALGLTPGLREFADRLRAAGHTVNTPDLFDGAVFGTLEEGERRRDELGIAELLRRANESIERLPSEVVYAGVSMGTGAAETFAATRNGARGAVLMHGAFAPAAFGIDIWPGVPLQVHYAHADPWVDPSQVEALSTLASAAGASVEVHRYERGGHLFEDPTSPGYDPGAARLMLGRVLAFLGGLAGAPDGAA